MEDLVAKFQDSLTSYGPSLVGAVLILVIGWIVARIVTRIMRRLLDRSRVDPTLVSFLTSLTYIGLMAFIVIGALGKLGVQTASFVAVIGAAGLAIGFALQGSLANFAAGVMLILFRPFKAGDYVEAGGVAGSIEEVQMFATVFKTPDNRRIVVPNASITSGSITNYAAHDTRRVDLVFGIGYGDDISLAKQVLQEILQAEERVLKDPEPTIAVSELADSSVNFVVRPWVMTADYWGVYFDLTERVKLAFDARGISIPFPQRDVHMHQAA
jgi:small conductance mechanosensitive channel